MERWDITDQERSIKAKVHAEFGQLGKVYPNLRTDVLERRIVKLVVKIIKEDMP